MDISTVQSTIACWWFNYDEAALKVWPNLVTSDVAFTCRSDTGSTPYEEFIRADVRGRDEFLGWQRDHRTNSPYPLRHNATNIHLTRAVESEADFMSYILVTHIVDGRVTNLSTGLCSGTVRIEDGVARLAELHVVLDTQDSVVLSTRPAAVGSH